MPTQPVEIVTHFRFHCVFANWSTLLAGFARKAVEKRTAVFIAFLFSS